MKKILLITILCFSAYLSMGQAHDAKYNFDFITYASGGPYNPQVPTDNAHYTGYLNIGFVYFVYFPNGNCADAYAVNQFNYVSTDRVPVKMQAQYDATNNTFIICPFNNQSQKSTTKIISYRKTKDGGVGELVLD